jgi:flagellar basal-body rod modification protein FlgD
MSTSAVSSTNSTTDTTATSSTKKSTSMGKDEFLTLLITQLQNQDPMSPMDNSEFIAQLAQFSSLEQMSNIASTTDSNYKSQASTSALSMIGKTVEWADADTGTTKSGKVGSVSFVDGMPKLNVGTISVEVSNVVKVS